MVKLVGIADPPVCFSLLQTDGRTGCGQLVPEVAQHL